MVLPAIFTPSRPEPWERRTSYTPPDHAIVPLDTPGSMTAYRTCSPQVARMRSVTPMSRLSGLMPEIADHTVSTHMNHGWPGSMGHAKHYFNKAKNSVYSRYSISDWKTSNKANFTTSEHEQQSAVRLRSDAWRAVHSTDKRTRNRQATNTKLLSDRTNDISCWKAELNLEMREMETEIDNLQEHKRVLENAYYGTKNPRAIAEECLSQRENRQGIDQVRDDVERQLSKEVTTIRKCQGRMRKLLEKAHIQLKMNFGGLHACDKDSQDKLHAQHLDDKMKQLRNCSMTISYHPEIATVNNTVTVPYSWAKFTQENIATSLKERETSEKLRSEIDMCLRNCANNMWLQFNAVNNTFFTRIQSMMTTKNKLQVHLQKTMNEIRDMERVVCLIKKAIQDKEAPMKVAQTRLVERSHRYNVELCNDSPMKGLQAEVKEITESLNLLKSSQGQAEAALQRLYTTKAKLTDDISVKENSLHIDAKLCMGMRKNMPMDPKIGPILHMPCVKY